MPIYLAISQGWLINSSKETVTETWFKFTIPIAIITTLICRTYFPAKNWGEYRTTYFVDPLSFCNYTLLFAFIGTIALGHYFKKLSTVHKLFYVVSIFIGFYLSATSGARTGWLNFPFFIIILQIHILKNYNNKQKGIGMFLLLVGLAVLMAVNNQLINKLYLGWEEFLSYKINGFNEDSSVGTRISLWRMGISYFFERPFAGWGDLSWKESMNSREFLIFASKGANETARHGFHNEIITNSVRSGIWGVIAVFSIYFVVFTEALKGLKMQLCGQHRLISISIMLVITHLFISGLSTETSNLTFLSAFVGIVLSVLLGEQKFLEENPVIMKKFT